jgi:hypothetical protein
MTGLLGSPKFLVNLNMPLVCSVNEKGLPPLVIRSVNEMLSTKLLGSFNCECWPIDKNGKININMLIGLNFI